MLMASITTQAQVTIGMNNAPQNGALLDLKQYEPAASSNATATKGLIYPRMNLTNVDELYPMYGSADPVYTANKADLKRKHTGLTVYNLTVNKDFTEGLYVWNGLKWLKLITEIPVSQTTAINKVDLKTNSETQDGGTSGSGGANLDFGQVVIPDNGAYAFNFRFYGSIKNISRTYRAVYYLSVWVGAQMKDIAEINVFPDRTDITCTYSIVMGAHFNVGDVVTFKLSHASTINCPWTLQSNPNAANNTSMVWWKL